MGPMIVEERRQGQSAQRTARRPAVVSAPHDVDGEADRGRDRRVAERVGFEPTGLAPGGFQDRCDRPPRHLSARRFVLSVPRDTGVACESGLGAQVWSTG